MRRRLLLLAALAAALTATAVGVAAGAAKRGNPAVGKALFLRSGVFCASCHTLKAAGSTGRDGPNLDTARPSYAKIVELVSKGRNPSKRWPTGMPRYAGPNAVLTTAMIRDIATFVYGSTHR